MATKPGKLQQQNSSENYVLQNARYFLSMKQRRVIPILLGAPTITEAARRAGISRAQLHRWFKDPLFVQEFKRQSHRRASIALTLLKGLAEDAVAAWGTCLHSENDHVKFAAAKALIENIEKSTALENQEVLSGQEMMYHEDDLGDFSRDRVEAMLVTAAMNAPSTMRAVLGLEPACWQRIVFLNQTRDELIDLCKKAGAPDVYGIMQAALMCLGALAGCFDPEAKKLCLDFMRVYNTVSLEERSEVSKKLRQRLKKFVLPPAEETNSHVSLFREAVLKGLDGEVDTEPFEE